MSSSRFTRREFLASTAAVALAGAVPVSHATAAERVEAFEPVAIPEWVYSVTRMAFCTPGEVGTAVEAGAQVIYGNAAWPYFPLRRDGGGLSAADAKLLRDFVDPCHERGAKLVLGLPPFGTPQPSICRRWTCMRCSSLSIERGAIR